MDLEVSSLKTMKKNTTSGFNKKLFQRFLSKFTWVDFAFLALTVSLVLIFYFFFKRETTYITVRFKVTDENPLYANTLPNNEYTSSFEVGDKEINELGAAVSEIVGVDSFNYDQRNNVVYLDVKLKTTYNPRKNSYVYKGKQVVFGQSFTFSFTKVRAKALVVNFPGYDDKFEKGFVTVDAQLRKPMREFSDVYGVEKFIADAIHIGDTVKDSRGRVLAEVVEVEKKPAIRWVFSERGVPTKVSDPNLVDVFLKIKLSVLKDKNRTYMFDFLPVLVGEVVPLTLDQVFVWPTITAIE